MGFICRAVWEREREIIEYLSPARSRRVSHKNIYTLTDLNSTTENCHRRVTRLVGNNCAISNAKESAWTFCCSSSRFLFCSSCWPTANETNQQFSRYIRHSPPKKDKSKTPTNRQREKSKKPQKTPARWWWVNAAHTRIIWQRSAAPNKDEIEKDIHKGIEKKGEYKNNIRERQEASWDR